jgi:hypothetical protein
MKIMNTPDYSNAFTRLAAPTLLITLFPYIGTINLSEPQTAHTSTFTNFSRTGIGLMQSAGPVEENLEKCLLAEPELSEAHIVAHLLNKGEIALQGTLVNSHQKQLALRVATEYENAEGGFRVIDELHVMPTAQFSVPGEMLIAADDGKLHHQEYWPPANLISGTRLNEMHRRHLQDVVNASKVLFPNGTKVQSVDMRGANRIKVNFNKAFTSPKFWRRHNSMKLAVYSIVNNIGNINLPKGPPLPVQILVEGKRVEAINGFSILEPRKPDMSLVARK